MPMANLPVLQIAFYRFDRGFDTIAALPVKAATTNLVVVSS